MKYENNRSGNGGVITLNNDQEEVGRLTYTIFPEENKLIISHPDYGIETIILADFKGNKIEVLLSDKVILSNTVAYAIFKKDRNYFLSLFRDHVLGRTVNRWNSKILNEDAIRFIWDNDNRILEAFAKSIPLKRVAQPEEVSSIVLYLASDDSSYSTGSEFIVDGGLTAQ